MPKRKNLEISGYVPITSITKAASPKDEEPDLSYIVEALRPLAIPIKQLKPDPKNARKHNSLNKNRVRKSLKAFGQRLPLVVQRQGMIVRVGNNRLAQAKKLGWTHVACVVVDESDVEAAAFAVTDNRVNEEGASWDEAALVETLREVNAALKDMEVMPFDITDLGWESDTISKIMDDGIDMAELLAITDSKQTALQSLHNGSLTGRRKQRIYTPDCIKDAVYKVWPRIQCDPCDGPDSLLGAILRFTEEDDGLAQEWPEFTFCNPPYEDLKAWIKHAAKFNEVMLLGPARTHRKWWRREAFQAAAICWLDPLRFVGYDMDFPAPLAVVYWGSLVDEFKAAFADLGDVTVGPLCEYEEPEVEVEEDGSEQD